MTVMSEALEHRHDDLMFGHSGDDVGIEILRLAGVVNEENPLAVAVRHPGFPPAAAAEQRGGEEEDQDVSHDAT